MVQSVSLNNQFQSLLGNGLGGFLQGNALGRNSEDNSSGGILNAKGLNLHSNSSTNKNLGGLSSLIPSSLKQSNISEPQKSLVEQQKDEKKKEDKVDISSFAEDAAKKAMETAQKSPKNGETNQVFVSEDGRFEASVDMRLNSDGSYDMDLALRFAQSSATMISGATQQALPQGDAKTSNQLSDLSYSGASLSAQRYTSFEQQLETRDFQARIFYEQTKTIAASAEQMHGSDIAGQITNASQQMAQEFKLNISISGKDLSNFSEVTDTLAQYDDTGTLSGFLQAAQGVLTADSSNIGSFMDATKSLLSATQEHVSAKLNDFFTGMNDQYGQTLQDMGFGQDFLKNQGTDVKSNLDSFFKTTNDMLTSMFGGSNAIETKDIKTQQVEALTASLDNLEQIRKDALQKDQEEAESKLVESNLNTDNTTDPSVSSNKTDETNTQPVTSDKTDDTKTQTVTSDKTDDTKTQTVNQDKKEQKEKTGNRIDSDPRNVWNNRTENQYKPKFDGILA